ncbi:MAG: response regulator transcription factor [Oscillospiraceae bacterium]|nr:response regulator transcription factor [Oscillospiraceae bacterium]
MRILVVEDEKHLNAMIAEALEDEGYSVDSCFNGVEALDCMACAAYDVIVLDVMMPKMDGLTLVRTLRSSGNATPVLFLTSRDSVADKVAGLESGGDYYLVKPFHFDELLAVVRAMTRKYTANRSNVYAIADLTLDAAAKTVTRAGQAIDLTAKEFSLLEYMLRNRGVVLSREMIENNLWNYDYEGGTNVVDVYIGYLRKKVDAPFGKKLIHTVWGTGWVLREDGE